MKKIIPIILSIAIFFILWDVLYKIENHEVIIPSINNTFNEIGNIVSSDNFLEIINATTIRTIIGFVISLVLGFAIGFISGLYKSFEDFMKPYIIFMRSTPSVAIVLLALIYVKSYNVPILVNFLICFPIIYQEVITGVKNSDKSVLELAKVHQISKFTTIRYVYLPSVFSHVISGVLNTISLSFKITISSEILSIPKYGIGSSIYTSKIYLNTAEVFAWIIIVFCICFVFDYIINIIRSYMQREVKHANSIK